MDIKSAHADLNPTSVTRLLVFSKSQRSITSIVFPSLVFTRYTTTTVRASAPGNRTGENVL